MHPVLDFIAERWSSQADADPAVVLAVAVAVLILALVPVSWHLLRQAATIIHEMGHVSAALVSRRRISGIRLHADTSGSTLTWGKSQGPGLLLTFLAGYPAPGLLAVALAWLALAGHAGAALTLYQAVVLLALLLSRNAVGILSCLVSVLVTGAIWWHNEPEIVLYTVVALAVFYGIAGLRATLDLWGSHLSRRRTSSGSDAAQAARAWRGLPLPSWVWLIVFLLISTSCAVTVVWLLIL
ncbi:M50 family metallopeptidase [Nesterenkonia sp. NBAIMH1]|uniref:M50 family metallopeptidase n=1 Tax=Nesterenkonia sp. NBAIMH1 TaxID=2600320 RepID=UPI0011B636D5|nr:M50 family metallopeptidase [Nesterenkonia sp. NBAIMH1]